MTNILPIINTCNQNCLFCSSVGRKDNQNRDYFNSIIVKTDGALVVSGGEPTISPDLFWVIKKAKERGLYVELQTNAITSCYDSLIQKIKDSEVDLLNINFSSHVREVDDEITQTNDLFEKKIEGIKNIQKNGLNFRLTCIVNSLNYKLLEDYVIYVSKEFKQVKYIQFSFIKIMGAVTTNKDIVVEYEKTVPFLKKAFKKCKNLSIDFVFDHIPLCYLSDYKDYHIDYQKFSQGIKPEYSKREKHKVKECKKCIYQNSCCGISSNYLKYFNNKVKVQPII